MALFVFLSVIGAAFLHAGWNAVIRGGSSKLTGMLVMTLVQGVAGLIWAMTLPWPAASVWPWLAASGIFHAGYKLFLAFAYERGDLSRVYPIARGTAPMIVLIISVLFLADVLTWAETLGVVLLGGGIVAMGWGALSSGEDRRLVPLALGSAAMTAGYSLVDGLGAREAGDAALYVAWLFVLDAALFTPLMWFLGGREVFRLNKRILIEGTVAAVGSYGAYLIAVWAMTQAPIALVAALRETSIFFAVVIGWLVFKERMDRLKIFAVTLILAGALVTRI